MSEVKVNKISPRSGTEVTLGDSGDTFTIPSGATINNQGTATNFGATGSASWVTTVKTGDFTAVAGEGYFVNTTSGEVDVTLPAGTAGAVVAIKDYAGTFDTNKVTLIQNGSDKIGGSTVNATLEVEGIAVTLVFIDSTQGWLVTDSGLQDEAPTAQFVAATGGTITTVCTNFKVHTFTGPGTFTVCSVGNAAGSNTIDYLVVAGGGAGGNKTCASGTGEAGGGGGAGGYRESPGTASGSYAVSPLGASPAAALPVTAAGYPVTVGAGGTGAAVTDTLSSCRSGSNSVFAGSSTITSAGGGGAGVRSFGGPNNKSTGAPGGSGGGGAYNGPTSAGDPGGAGNTPPVNPPQGESGGTRVGGCGSGGGGGGATVAGAAAGGPGTPLGSGSGGPGGAGATSSINGTPTARAGGGGGGGNSTDYPSTGNPGAGGAGGGGAGGDRGVPPTQAGVSGTTNSGGGGGAGSGGSPSPGPGAVGNGGSGIVIIRYKFQ
jgi:hypothetical protein